MATANSLSYRAWRRTTALFRPPLQFAVLLLSMAAAVSPVSAVDTIRVAVDVRVDDEILRKQFQSYFRRELRNLADVEVVELSRSTIANYIIRVGIIPINSGAATRMGWAVTAGLFKTCLNRGGIPATFPNVVKAVNAAPDSTTNANAWTELAFFFFDCDQEVSRGLYTFGLEPNWLPTIRGWIATWDSDHFEPNR